MQKELVPTGFNDNNNNPINVGDIMEIPSIENPWIPLSEVDFSDEGISSYHVDTRDFHVNCHTNGEIPPIDLFKTRKYPDNYFFTPDEIKTLIERYFKESGGEAKWRMFVLDGAGKLRTINWQLKYIRIYRLPHRMYKGRKGLVIYDNRDKFLFPKDMLASDLIGEEILCTH